MRRSKLKIWELSLLFALCVSLCQTAAEAGRQSVLAEKIIRMHVIASSDEPEAQELKLAVRDAVEEILEPAMAGADSALGARQLIEARREDILAAAQKAAGEESVELLWGTESYGYRKTESYSLPAGEYCSLRIVLGEGKGHNWWGVIFPQLDSGGGYAEAVQLLDDEELALVYEDEGYELRFRLLELLRDLRSFFR